MKTPADGALGHHTWQAGDFLGWELDEVFAPNDRTIEDEDRQLVGTNERLRAWHRMRYPQNVSEAITCAHILGVADRKTITRIECYWRRTVRSDEMAKQPASASPPRRRVRSDRGKHLAGSWGGFA